MLAAAGDAVTRRRRTRRIDAADTASLPTLGRTTHGTWLRERPDGPPVSPTRSLARLPDALRCDACALVQQHGFGGRTFWIDASDQPRCCSSKQRSRSCRSTRSAQGAKQRWRRSFFVGAGVVR